MLLASSIVWVPKGTPWEFFDRTRDIATRNVLSALPFNRGIARSHPRVGLHSSLCHNSIHKNLFATLTVVVSLAALLALQATAQRYAPATRGLGSYTTTAGPLGRKNCTIS